MSDPATREENRDIAAVVIAGILVAVSIALGVAVWFGQGRVEQMFKELGVQLPGITIFAIDWSVGVVGAALLAGCAAMIAIKGLRMIGLCSWVVVLFLYLGIWSLAFGLPFVKMTKQLGEPASSHP